LAVVRRRTGAFALDREPAVDGVDDAAELDDSAVANELHKAAVVCGDCRVEGRLAVLLQCGQCPGFIDLHQPRIADDVGGEHRCEPPVDALLDHDDRMGGATGQRSLAQNARRL
jgi:RecJ-like exonuclease